MIFLGEHALAELLLRSGRFLILWEAGAPAASQVMRLGGSLGPPGNFGKEMRPE